MATRRRTGPLANVLVHGKRALRRAGPVLVVIDRPALDHFASLGHYLDELDRDARSEPSESREFAKETGRG